MTAFYGELRSGWDPDDGTDRVYRVIDVQRTDSSLLAARWAHGWARRLADQLNETSEVQTEVAGTARRFDLRGWAANPHADRVAQAHIKAGDPLIISATDEGVAFVLTVWPFRQPADESPIGEPQGMVHRIGGLAHALYVVADDPWRER
ncbi:hypothetical protein [Streptomyces catenulae]|uniref:Uncharacterized protein n=1 Tax=Streptomyces catenulae TaxID=66875 RepID=A0ABV2Z8T5_9ACTN|nr:hypothetical protein [Streptomyces catenulae]